MDSCDVLIVGGGPAGSSCARRLRQAGLDVLVLDRKTFPRDKTCAGWITPAVVDELEFDTDEYRKRNVFQPITGFRTGMIGGREVESFYDEPASYGIRRCEFDHYLLRRSQARCRLGESAKDIRRENGGWIVGGEIQARMLVGAGGHFCPVARMLGNRRNPASTVVTAQEIEFEVAPEELDRGSVRPDVPELLFCEDLKGYGWCFRKGNFLNIGLGRTESEGLSEQVAAFCDYLRERGKIACEVPGRFHGHAYQLYERIQPKLIDDGVLLIGDAAGLAYPQSGEGIRPAVESGLLAAETILSAGGQYGRAALAPYEAQIIERFGEPRSKGAADWLPAGWLHFLAARLLATRWFSKSVVLDRWFLHVHQPALVT